MLALVIIMYSIFISISQLAGSFFLTIQIFIPCYLFSHGAAQIAHYFDQS